MKPSEVFGICIRILGLLGIIGGILYIIDAMYLLLSGQEQHAGFYVGEYILSGIILTVVALYFIRGAPHIVRFAYPKDKEEQDSRV
jgi:hypothetical protein